MHVLRTALVALALTTVCLAASADCPRNVAAIRLANDGDKVRALDLDGAIAKYEEATRADPENHRIVWKLANAYLKKEDWEKADEALTKATALAPTFETYFLAKGKTIGALATRHKRPWLDAKAPLETAIVLDPNDAEPVFALAEVMLRLGDEKAALDDYTRAIELKPDEIGHYEPLADLYLRLGFPNEAEAVAKEGLSWDKGDARSVGLHLLYAHALLDKHQWADGLAELESAKAACGQCNEKGQETVFFSLGVAYATTTPPHAQEAVQNLTSFMKRICRGAQAARYPAECRVTQELLARMGMAGR